MKNRVTVKGDLPDLAAVAGIMADRRKRIGAAPAQREDFLPVNELAKRLHPSRLNLVITSTRKETDVAKTFRLAPDPDSDTTELPVFRPGQYLSFKIVVDDVLVSRPYSICSSPREALEENFVEITVRKKPGGFVTGHIWKNWKKGVKVQSSGPCGFFYHEELRDSKDVLGLVGGCGITPFRALAKHMIDEDLDMNITLLYGIRKPDEIIYKKEMPKLVQKAGGRLDVHYICSEPDKSWDGPTGFMTRKLIKKLAGGVDGKTLFICGPQPMYTFLEKELAPLKIPQRRIRREVFGELDDVTTLDGFPKKKAGKKFKALVRIGNSEQTIPVRSDETVLVALERAGIAPPSQCRSGECGFCNSLLISGNVFVVPENDGRRMALRKFGYFHPCSSYPLSDLEIRATRDV